MHNAIELLQLSLGYRSKLTSEFIEQDWTDLYNFSERQSITGVLFSGIEKLPKDQLPPMDLLMDWLGQVEYGKTMYNEHKSVIKDLAAFYQKHDIKLMLLKGYGISKYWPLPNLRPVGDIDSYNFGKQKLADKVLEKELGIIADYGHEHHTTFTFEGAMVENHYDIIDTKTNRLSSGFDKKFKELAHDGFIADPEIPNLYYPSATFNATFLIKHMGNHFAGNKASLRQLLDWALFMDKESKNVDWDTAIPFLEEMGIYDFFRNVNAACVKYLGFDKEKFMVEGNEPLADRIFNDILCPEFTEQKDMNKSTFMVICFKLKRFFANGWKRRLVHNESLFCQLVYGSWAHLRRFSTIKD